MFACLIDREPDAASVHATEMVNCFQRDGDSDEAMDKETETVTMGSLYDQII